MSSGFGEVALCRCPMGPSSMLPSGHQSQMFQGCHLWGCILPFVVVEPNAVGMMVDGAGPWPHVVAAGMLLGWQTPSTAGCVAQ